ncbi:MAG: hypothetical protein JRN62_03580 [Nitrososphaerota archaeon]|jgi:hypothetical protein|nr:hypothetical protein [Nitrososphaerota archaeon]MDG6948682.1 hypothetical protein [Nitrososphaerota archaeon]
MNSSLADKLEALTKKRAIHPQEADALYGFAKRVRNDQFLPGSAKLQKLHEETTLSIAGHNEFTSLIVEYQAAEEKEKTLTPAQREGVRVQWLRSAIVAKADAFAARVRGFATNEDEFAHRPVFGASELTKLVNNTEVPQSYKTNLILAIKSLQKKADAYDDDMAAAQHVWASGFGGLEGKALEKEMKEFYEMVTGLRNCNLDPDF